jgi:IclR family acetate operon transcriptional repressor
VSFEATLRKISLPILESLLKTTTETVNLGVLEGFRVLYLSVLESPHRFRLVSEMGTHGPISSTALGKAILANMEEGPRKDELFASISFKANTPRTLVTMGRLKADLARTRTRGYSEDDEEAFVGARCIGAAIRGADGSVVAAVSVSGPTSRISRERLSFYSTQVCHAAQEISWALGYRPSKSQRTPGKSSS